MADPTVELPIAAYNYTMEEIPDPIAHIPLLPLISTNRLNGTKPSSTAKDMDLSIESPPVVVEQKETEQQHKTPPIDNNDLSVDGGETDMALEESNPLEIDECLHICQLTLYGATPRGNSLGKASLYRGCMISMLRLRRISFLVV